MKYVINNIDKRIAQVSKYATPNARLTKSYVEDVYRHIMPTLPENWGTKRRKESFRRSTFNCAMNLLKAYRLKGIRTKAGYIYLLKHPKFAGYVKIGKTVDVVDRLSQYNVGCPTKEYYVFLYFWCEDMNKAEKEMHSLFRNYRAQGEWFLSEDNELAYTKTQMYQFLQNKISGAII